ncbi:hypothetical protein DPMN_074096 [Dreissena polymorpha]|uniref:Uncharacterized protein n=1 Tax=Dreissena polymorpha TaxID=45954 RepID=A0A9D3YEB5_DREPO|nr:hypothetical protein DPMN_074096 [Dreissena polymorpha]
MIRHKNVASRVLTRKNAPPPDGHVFQATGTIFRHVQDIMGTKLLTKLHDDRTINVASRVLTRKNAPPHGNIIWTNLLTKFHEDQTINVASRVLTRKNSRPLWPCFSNIIGTNLLTKELTRKNAPPNGGHVFQPTGIIFELVQDIIGMNFLTKFHEDQTINVDSRVLTSHLLKIDLPLGGHVFQANVTVFELIQDIIEINL